MRSIFWKTGEAFWFHSWRFVDYRTPAQTQVSWGTKNGPPLTSETVHFIGVCGALEKGTTQSTQSDGCGPSWPLALKHLGQFSRRCVNGCNIIESASMVIGFVRNLSIFRCGYRLLRTSLKGSDPLTNIIGTVCRKGSDVRFSSTSGRSKATRPTSSSMTSAVVPLLCV